MHSQKKDLVLFLLVFIAVVLLHGRAYDAGFVTDFTGLWSKMQGKTIMDALQSFGFPSLMPLLNVFYFFLYKIFGLNGLPWFLFFCAVYSTGVFFFYRTALELITREDRYKIALATVLLIILSPYQVEALIWKVGLGHLASVCFFMIALFYGVRHLKEGGRKNHILLLFWQVCSLFCFEWAMVFPLVIAILGIYLRSRKTVKTVLSSALIVLFYLLLTKLFIGKAVGHYEITAAQVFDLPVIIGTAAKYLIKHLALVHFWDYEWKAFIYNISGHPVIIVAMLILGVLSVYKLVKVKSNSSRLSWALLLCCFCSLLLVLPLYFQFILLSENDRYGSLLVPFISLLIVLFLSRLPRLAGGVLFLVYLLGNLHFQQKLVSQWRQSQAVVNDIVDSWPEDLDGNTLLLNLPDNYNGNFMFRDFSGDNPIVDHLAMLGHPTEEVDLVAQYNIPDTPHKYQAQRLDDFQLEIQAEKWGSWWWRKGIGATDYDDEHYSLKILDGRKAVITLKQESYYDNILFFDGVEIKRIE